MDILLTQTELTSGCSENSHQRPCVNARGGAWWLHLSCLSGLNGRQDLSRFLSGWLVAGSDAVDVLQLALAVELRDDRDNLAVRGCVVHGDLALVIDLMLDAIVIR